jgi:hypothetical protein
VCARQVRPTLVVWSLLAVTVCGCSAQNWPPQLNFTPPPNPYAAQKLSPTANASPPVAREQPPTVKTQAKAHRRKHAAKKVAAKTTTALPDNAAVTEAPNGQGEHERSAPAVTLVGGAADQNRAQALVHKASENFAKIDRNSLKGENVAKYDQIQGFVNAAQHALDEQNYELAFALATKAVSLTDQLKEKTR